MVLAIDALMVGSRTPPLATLDVAGNMRVSQDVQLAQWNVGSLGILYGGLPANSAALMQTPTGQTTLNTAAGAPLQFADGGVVGLQYSHGNLLGNLVLSGSMLGSGDQVVQVQSNSSSNRKLKLMSTANNRAIIDTTGCDLQIGAQGNTGLSVNANGTVTAPNVNLGNASANVLQVAQISGPGNVLCLNGAVGLNQPNPAVGLSVDCLGNVRFAGGGVRIDGTSTATPDLSLGYPGTLSMDSSGVVGGRLFIDNSGRANIGGPLNVAGAVSATGPMLLAQGAPLSLNGDPFHTVQFDTATDGVRVQGFGGGVLGTSQNVANALFWTNNSCSTYLPFQVFSPLTVTSNTTILGLDPYVAIGNCVLATSGRINQHSNVASPGDVVLKNKINGNVILQSSNLGPAVFINQVNAVGIQTPTINPLTSLDVCGPAHYGVDNAGSRIINLTGKTLYSSVPAFRCLAVFYANTDAGNGAHLTVKGPCGTWTGPRGDLVLTVTSSGGIAASAQWIGSVPSGLDVQVFNNSGVASVWVVVTAAYCTYNFDVTYGSQGFTSLASAETAVAPTGTLIYSCVSNFTQLVGNGQVTIPGSLTVTSNVGIGQSAPVYPLDVDGYQRTGNRKVAFKFTMTSTSISYASGTKEVLWQTVDPSLPYSTITGGRFVAPVAGLYTFTFHFGMGSGNSSAQSYIIFMSRSPSSISSPDPSGNSAVFSANQQSSSVSNYIVMECTSPLMCAAGDVIQSWISNSVGVVSYSWPNQKGVCYLSGMLISTN